MKFKEIHTFGEAFNGKTPSKAEKRTTGLPILKIRDIDENGKFRGNFKSFVDEEFYIRYSKKKLKTGDTIILNAAHNSEYVGSKNALVPPELNGIIATGEWLIVRVSQAASYEYVNHFLKSPMGRRRLKTQVKGIHLYPKDVERIKAPAPPLDDQIRIAYLLSKVEGLITQRKQQLQGLDDLLKSVFLEMFGPTNSEFEVWPLVEIKDLAAKHKGAMRTGPFGSNLLHSEFTPDGDIAVLGIDNAVKNCFAWGERRYITNEKYKELKNYRIFPSDIIITIMGTIGRSAVIPDDIPLSINTKHLAAITLNRELANPLFLSYSIHSSPYILNQFKSKSRGAIMSGLNLTIIKETKLRRPPIEQQNAFASIHVRVDEIKAQYQQSLSELENLYGVLSQKAFKGELDLSNVPLVAIESQSQIPKLDEAATALREMAAQQAEQMKQESRMSFPESRERILRSLFDGFIKEAGESTFTFDVLWQQINFKLIDIIQEPEESITVDDYDMVKKWLFKYLENGTSLEQITEKVIDKETGKESIRMVLQVS